MAEKKEQTQHEVSFVKKQSKQEQLSQALRDNLRRRKTVSGGNP